MQVLLVVVLLALVLILGPQDPSLTAHFQMAHGRGGGAYIRHTPSGVQHSVRR